MTKFYDAVYSFECVGGYQFVKLYISMFEKWLESPQWLLAVSKPEVRMRVTSAWGQEYELLLLYCNLRHMDLRGTGSSLGPVSISEKTSFRKISQSLEAARFVFRNVRSL